MESSKLAPKISRHESLTFLIHWEKNRNKCENNSKIMFLEFKVFPKTLFESSKDEAVTV